MTRENDPTALLDLIRTSKRANAVHQLLREARAGMDTILSDARAAGRFSLARALNEMASGGLVSGLEAEVAQEAARAAGGKHDPHRAVFPWAVFSRDLTVASASGGGYLTSTDVGDVVDVLRPYSVTAASGLQVETGLTSSLTLPRVTAVPTAAWLSTEGTAATESQPTLGSVTIAPKMVGAYTEASRLLLKQAPVLADRMVRDQLLRVVGRSIDVAVLAGSGASGQPTGILNTPGIGTQAGASLTWAGVLNMLKTATTANATDSNIVYLATPAVREILQAREVVSTSGRFLWDADQIANRPARVTTDMPAATMLAGDFSTVLLALFGAGLTVEVNPYAQFAAGIVGFRCLVHADVGVLQPAAFVAATSVS
jgi:HK97 family phage major capsid protein